MKLTANFKKFLSALLVLVMVFSMVPVTAMAEGVSAPMFTFMGGASKNASGDTQITATNTTLDAAVFFSDLHSTKTDSKTEHTVNTMAAVAASGLPISAVTSCGDVFSTNSSNNYGNLTTITNNIRTGLSNPNVPVYYVWSDHDRNTSIADYTGLVHGAGSDGIYGTSDDGNYYIYLISMSDISTNDRYNTGVLGLSQSTLDKFTTDVASLDHSKPLFIASHQPLLDRRNDNGNAYKWWQVIDAAAKTMDIIYLFGHNHKYDVASDYYYAKGSTMAVCNSSSGSSTNVTLNFTHMCAGYLEPSTTGSTSNTTRQGTVMVANIMSNCIQMTTYNKNGIYSGNYSINVTIPRAFANAGGTTDPTDPDPTVPEECEHSYAAVTTEATCTKDGKVVYTCTLCGDYYSEVIPATGHNYQATATYDPTCVKDGYTVYSCSCGLYYNSDKVAALGHDYVSTVTPATCTTAGYTTNVCSVCNDTTVTDEVAALGHSYTGVENSDGTTVTYTCICGDNYTEEILNYTYAKASKFTTSGKFVITMYSGGKYYALSHKNDEITAVQVTVSNNKITSRVTEDMLWRHSSKKLYYKDDGTTYYLTTTAASTLFGSPTLGINTSNAATITYGSSKLKVGSSYLRFSNNTVSLNRSATTVYLYKQA